MRVFWHQGPQEDRKSTEEHPSKRPVRKTYFVPNECSLRVWWPDWCQWAETIKSDAAETQTKTVESRRTPSASVEIRRNLRTGAISAPARFSLSVACRTGLQLGQQTFSSFCMLLDVTDRFQAFCLCLELDSLPCRQASLTSRWSGVSVPFETVREDGESSSRVASSPVEPAFPTPVHSGNLRAQESCALNIIPEPTSNSQDPQQKQASFELVCCFWTLLSW